LVYPCDQDIKIGDKCEKGSQLRPNVVWFGEELNDKLIKDVKKHLNECAVLVVVGTSLEVSPANQLVRFINQDCKLIVIDPNPNHTFLSGIKIKFIENTATKGILDLKKLF
jgi:NAD-dependent deacetylase